MTKRSVDSSFIDWVGYVPMAKRFKEYYGKRKGFLIVSIGGTEYYYLAPSWAIGLFAATDACADLSIGHLYNVVIKGVCARVSA